MALGVADLGVAEDFLEAVAINPTTELPELTQDCEIVSWRNLVCPRTQEKGAVTPQETDPDLPVSVQESPAEMWVSDGLLWVGGAECRSAHMGPFEGGHHYLHYLHHSLAPGK